MPGGRPTLESTVSLAPRPPKQVSSLPHFGALFHLHLSSSHDTWASRRRDGRHCPSHSPEWSVGGLPPRAYTAPPRSLHGAWHTAGTLRGLPRGRHSTWPVSSELHRMQPVFLKAWERITIWGGHEHHMKPQERSFFPFFSGPLDDTKEKASVH